MHGGGGIKLEKNTRTMEKKDYVTTSIRLTKELHEKIKELAALDLRTINAEINFLLFESVEQHKSNQENNDK